MAGLRNDPYRFNFQKKHEKKRTEYEPQFRGAEVAVGLAGCRTLTPEEIQRATSHLPAKPPGRT